MKFDIQTLLISGGSFIFLAVVLRMVIKSKNNNNKITNKDGNVVVGDDNKFNQK